MKNIRKYAGIDNNEKLIERLAELKLFNSKIFINSFSNSEALVLGSIEDIAYSKTKKLEEALVLGSIEDIAYSKTKKLELELHNARNTKTSNHKLNDSYVNWSTWRQFNSLKNHLDRLVFDEFITKTKFISSIVESRFSLIKQVYQEYQSIREAIHENNISLLSGYLQNERISNNQLIEFIKSVETAANHIAKRDSLKALNEV